VCLLAGMRRAVTSVAGALRRCTKCASGPWLLLESKGLLCEQKSEFAIVKPFSVRVREPLIQTCRDL
jgi:hypothetical protein